MAVTTSSIFALVILRLFLAWMVGGALYFISLVVTSYDGFNTFVSGIVGGSIVSALCVAASAIFGLLLLISRIKSFWCKTYFPALGLFVLGFFLFVFGLLPSQVKTIGIEYGSSIKEVGIAWGVGYLFIIFAIANFPNVSKSDSKHKIA